MSGDAGWPDDGVPPFVPRGRTIVLASGSPRRADLLDRLGVPFVVEPSDIDETPMAGETPEVYVARLAREKADACRRSDVVVVAADTTVDVDGEILAKPDDDDHARAMLRRLSGRTHRVHTGVAVRADGTTAVEVVTTLVRMVPLTDATIDWYLSTGEHRDKAGAYAVQGIASVLVDEVRGSVSNVVGLPLATVAAMLGRIPAAHRR